jgi:MFS family permease
MQQRIFLWSLVSALAGFLFGFDTVVISGAEKTIEKLWELSPEMHGLAMSAALWGTVLGSFLGSWPTDRYGRKKTLLWIGVLFLAGSVWSALAMDVYSFMIARFIGGLGIGISTVAAPLYISEISPPERRGRLAGMFQFNIVFGILVAFLSNYLLQQTGEGAWRWMLGIMAIPSLLYTVLCFGIPESPRWLLTRKGDRAAGLAVLKLIQPTATESELHGTAEHILAAAAVDNASTEGFWSKRMSKPIVLAILIAFFNQLSGINAILYFAPRIFGLTGSGAEDALRNSVGIGITNLIFTFVGLWLIDRLGRRTLLYIGSFGYILSLGLCAVSFFGWEHQFKAASRAWELSELSAKMEKADTPNREAVAKDYEKAKLALQEAGDGWMHPRGEQIFPANATPAQVKEVAQQKLTEASERSGPGGLIVLLCIFAFIASHAIGQGAVIWVFISEIFPDKYRATGQSLGSFTHWIFAALLTLLFPLMITAFAPGWVFALFCGMMVLQLIWVKTMVVETKGVPLEDIERKLGIQGLGNE